MESENRQAHKGTALWLSFEWSHIRASSTDFKFGLDATDLSRVKVLTEGNISFLPTLCLSQCELE